MLLDEPLSALDQPVREELQGVLRATLRELAVPAIHVTHDCDEALRLADDLAILAAGTLRQTGPAGHLTRHPTDAVTARLLGWTALGPTRHDTDGLHVGDLPVDPTVPGAVGGTVYYRAEEVLLGEQHQCSTAALRTRAQIREIVPTTPLARVLLATTPPLTALVLHRDLNGLGNEVEITVPHHALRILPPEMSVGQ